MQVTEITGIGDGIGRLKLVNFVLNFVALDICSLNIYCNSTQVMYCLHLVFKPHVRNHNRLTVPLIE